MRVALIDADTLVYQAALHVEVPIQWNEWLWTLHSNFDDGMGRLDEMVESIREGLQADRLVMVLSDYSAPNWRLGVMPDYKQHRKRTRRPIIWKPLREYIHEKYETFQRPTLEGDDVLGILGTHPKIIPGEKIIVSIDKDMKTVPGRHLNYDKAWEQTAQDESLTLLDLVREITGEGADRFHMIQTIAGDSTDGYAGAPGWGMVTAERLLDSGKILEPYEHTFTRGPRKGEIEVRWQEGPEGTPWEVVCSAYRKSGLGEGAALINARVSRICRACDYDFDKKEVRLWEPPR